MHGFFLPATPTEGMTTALVQATLTPARAARLLVGLDLNRFRAVV